jgi:hypothetical protein
VRATTTTEEAMATTVSAYDLGADVATGQVTREADATTSAHSTSPDRRVDYGECSPLGRPIQLDVSTRPASRK